MATGSGAEGRVHFSFLSVVVARRIQGRSTGKTGFDDGRRSEARQGIRLDDEAVGLAKKEAGSAERKVSGKISRGFSTMFSGFRFPLFRFRSAPLVKVRDSEKEAVGFLP